MVKRVIAMAVLFLSSLQIGCTTRVSKIIVSCSRPSEHGNFFASARAVCDSTSRRHGLVPTTKHGDSSDAIWYELPAHSYFWPPTFVIAPAPFPDAAVITVGETGTAGSGRRQIASELIVALRHSVGSQHIRSFEDTWTDS